MGASAGMTGVIEGRWGRGCGIRNMEEGAAEARDEHAVLLWEWRRKGLVAWKVNRQCVVVVSERQNRIFTRWYLLSISIDQAAVGLDFFLQVDLDVQQLLVLQLLTLGLGSDLVQLLLQGPNLSLDLGQLRTVVAFGLGQGALQGVFLRAQKMAEQGMKPLWGLCRPVFPREKQYCSLGEFWKFLGLVTMKWEVERKGKGLVFTGDGGGVGMLDDLAWDKWHFCPKTFDCFHEYSWYLGNISYYDQPYKIYVRTHFRAAQYKSNIGNLTFWNYIFIFGLPIVFLSYFAAVLRDLPTAVPRPLCCVSPSNRSSISCGQSQAFP